MHNFTKTNNKTQNKMVPTQTPKIKCQGILIKLFLEKKVYEQRQKRKMKKRVSKMLYKTRLHSVVLNCMKGNREKKLKIVWGGG